MKILPSSGSDRKLFFIALALAFVLHAGKILELGSSSDLVVLIINWLVSAVLIMIVLRVLLWIAKKAGIVK